MRKILKLLYTDKNSNAIFNLFANRLYKHLLFWKFFFKPLFLSLGQQQLVSNFPHLWLQDAYVIFISPNLK